MSDNPTDPQCVAAALEALAIVMPPAFYDLPLHIRMEVALRPPVTLDPVEPPSAEDLYRWNAVRSTIDDIIFSAVQDEQSRETGNMFGSTASASSLMPSPPAASPPASLERTPPPFGISGIDLLPDSDVSSDSLPIHPDWHDCEAQAAMDLRAGERRAVVAAAAGLAVDVLPIIVQPRGYTLSEHSSPPPPLVADSSSSSDSESVVTVVNLAAASRSAEVRQGAVRRPPRGASHRRVSPPSSGLPPLPTFSRRQTRLEHLAAASVQRGRDRIAALQAAEQQEASMVRELSEVANGQSDSLWRELESVEASRRQDYLAAVEDRRNKVKSFLSRPVQKRIHTEAAVSRAILLASGGTAPQSDPGRRDPPRRRPARAVRGLSPHQDLPSAVRPRLDNISAMSPEEASAWAQASARAEHERRLKKLNVVPLFSMLRDYSERDDIVDEEVVNSYRCCVRFWRTCPFCGSRWSGVRTSAGQPTHCLLKHCAQWLNRDPLANHCIYDPCTAKVGHLVMVCPTLHRLCDQCGTRGHAAGRCGDQLEQMAVFEKYKELGMHTRKPKDWGFFGPLMPASYLRLYRANGLSLWMNWPGGPAGFQSMGDRRRGEVMKAAIWE